MMNASCGGHTISRSTEDARPPLPHEKGGRKMKRVYKLDIHEIINFDEIETLEEAEYDLVEVIEGSSPDECFEKAMAVYGDERFAWSYVY
jgi:hypothetical protein